MIDDRWSQIDRYFEGSLLGPDPVLADALRSSQQAELPPIQVSPSQGKLLHLLASAIGARRILEIGTLGGYSAIWLARALPPDGQLITLEVNPRHAAVARANLERAGLLEKVEIRLGPALESLRSLTTARVRPFDLAFIDADKPNTRPYFDQCVRLLRPGGLIVVDNVARKGELVNAESDDPNVVGMRAFVDALAVDHRVSATGIQTVGSKGYDGFVLARVLDGGRPERPARFARRPRAIRPGARK